MLLAALPLDAGECYPFLFDLWWRSAALNMLLAALSLDAGECYPFCSMLLPLLNLYY